MNRYNIANIINPLTRLWLMLLLPCSIATTMYAQQGSQGNTVIFNNGEMTLFGAHDFVTGGSGVQPGVIGTMRTATFGILNFSSASSYTGSDNSNYVDGYVRKLGSGNFIFPVGDNGRFAPFAAAADGTTGAYYNADPSTAITSDLSGGNYPALPAGAPFPTASRGTGVVAVSGFEYWDIDGATATPITLTWDASSDVTTLTSNWLKTLTILGWNGSQWEAIPSTVDATSILGGSSTLTAGSITTNSSITPDSYSAFTLGALSVPLPVELVDFTAKKKQSAVLLNWETSQEINSDKFEVEHSTNGDQWKMIGTVKAQGNSNEPTHYSFTHTAPFNGMNQYRLKMIDIDGSAEYSPVRNILFDNNQLIFLYPNPAPGYVFLNTERPENIQVIRILDVAGKEVLLQQGLQQPKLNLGKLKAGTYILQIIFRQGSMENHQLVVGH